jgi:type IV pilus assembly protein PilY1
MTPLREALSRVGRHYAGKRDKINDGMDDDPVQYSCQPNVSILSTDGYWNGNQGDKIDGTSIGNHDNSNSGYSTRASGAYDGNLNGASGTLADVAMYYYSTDLRTNGATGALGTDVSANDVPASLKDTNPQQHMLTFTIGLGLGGLMQFIPNYEAATFGDFYSIKVGNTGCRWGSSTGVCNWPVPPSGTDVDDNPAKIDDLWHAAVNGRGRYVSANDAPSLYDGLVTALADLRVLLGAAAASATSSPNITTTDNAIFSSTYRTTRWDGELVAQRVDPVSGAVSLSTDWSARDLLNGRVGPSTDTRTIYTSLGGTRIPFQWADMDATTRALFSSKCAQLSQCPTLTAAQQAVVNDGANLVNFLRGQRQHEPLLREREYVLGDLVGSRPMFVREPRRSYGDPVSPSYFDFKNANANRRAVVYIGGNDGMLHAFDDATGEEAWAFIPRDFYRTAPPVSNDKAGLIGLTYQPGGLPIYAHRFYVDSTPRIADVDFANGGADWRTLLVGGLGKGGRSYYALDVTNPASVTDEASAAAKVLWEFRDTDLGYTYGRPMITKTRAFGWTVIVSAGYNNPSGEGKLYFLRASDGTLLKTMTTGFGSAASPSGLTHFAGFTKDFRDQTVEQIYGGDLYGNLWRFDVSDPDPAAWAVKKFAYLTDSSGAAQPITTPPRIDVDVSNGIDRWVFVGTGRLLHVDDPAH